MVVGVMSLVEYRYRRTSGSMNSGKRRRSAGGVDRVASDDDTVLRVPKDTGMIEFNVEHFFADVANAVNDLTFDGFDVLEEHAAQSLRIADQALQTVLKQGIDKTYQKVQERLDETLKRWESQCRSSYLVAPVELATLPAESRQNAAAVEAWEKALDAKLDAIRSEISAARDEEAKMRVELDSLEKRLELRSNHIEALRQFAWDGNPVSSSVEKGMDETDFVNSVPLLISQVEELKALRNSRYQQLKGSSHRQPDPGAKGMNDSVDTLLRLFMK